MNWKSLLGKYVGAMVVTVFAAVAALTYSAGDWGHGGDDNQEPSDEMRAMPVSVATIDIRPVHITDTYAGILRPMERYSLGFQVAGRIEAFGTNQPNGKGASANGGNGPEPAPGGAAALLPDGNIRPVAEFQDRPDAIAPGGAGRGHAGGRPLDVGDVVCPGQVLARLDQKAHEAHLREAEARLEQCRAELRLAQLSKDRASRAREMNPDAVSDPEWDQILTDEILKSSQVQVAEAQLAVARKNLADTTLVVPDDIRWSHGRGNSSLGRDPPGSANPGLPRPDPKAPVDPPARLPQAPEEDCLLVISKRLANVGESVNPQQEIFEILQVDRLLLVVGVPEAYVRQIAPGQPVDVRLLAQDRFRSGRDAVSGRVYEVAEAADQTTGLFEVEIEVPNRVLETMPDGRIKTLLKPGLIARADIVVRTMQAFPIPSSAVLFREDPDTEREQAYILTVDQENKAHRLKLTRWIEQEIDGRPYVIVEDLRPQHRTIVTRGQHRLVEDCPVRILERDGQPVATESSQ